MSHHRGTELCVNARRTSRAVRGLRLLGLGCLTSMVALPAMAIGMQRTEDARVYGTLSSTYANFGTLLATNDRSLFYYDPDGLGQGEFVRSEFDGLAWAERERFDPVVRSNGQGLWPETMAATNDTLVYGDALAYTPSPAMGAVVTYDLTRQPVVPTQVLLSDLPAQGYAFGYSVAISGDVLVVGEFNTTRGGTYPVGSSGAAHVFARGANGLWVRTQVLTPRPACSPPQYDRWWGFGRAVAVDGNTIVVGVYATNDSQQGFPFPEGGIGMAVVYEKVGGTWVDTACLRVPPLSNIGDGCFAVAVRGDRILASERRDTPPGTGRVHVYERQGPGPGNWQRTASLGASDGVSFGTTLLTDNFGWHLALGEDRFLVGAPEASPNASQVYWNHGAGYLYTLRNGLWEEERLWTTRTFLLPGSQADRVHGYRVAFVEDGLFVSARVGIDPAGASSGVICYYQDPISSVVCPGASNSVSIEGARFDVRGQRQSGTGRLGFVGRQFPANALALLLASDRAGQSPNPGGSQGTLCLGSPVIRLGPTVHHADAAGSWSAALDLGQPATAALLPVQAGSRWRFQAWYRDANPTVTSNFSEAHEIEFR